MEVGDVVVIDRVGVDRLLAALGARGFRTIGPVVRDGAVVHGDVSDTADLPVGWHDEQEPGAYRVYHDDDPRLFAWAVGPHSLKAEVFPARTVVWRSDGPGEAGQRPAGPVAAGFGGGPPTAVVGARPCEVAALDVLDAVLSAGAVRDPDYAMRREAMFVVAVDCGSPAGTCFCVSMGTGPEATSGFDLALTELADANGHRFVVRVGSARGAEVMGEVVDGAPWHPPGPDDLAGRGAVVDAARATMGRSLDTDDLADLLARTLEHPRWAEVADRCLACGNCTLVCPTCFCSTMEDTTDLRGAAQRSRRWASCFEERHSYLHGGAVRGSTRSRYRQWMTHKLGTWHDQFAMSGCVGCGRCIAWCPVGIDITEEVAAIRSTEELAEDEGGRT